MPAQSSTLGYSVSFNPYPDPKGDIPVLPPGYPVVSVYLAQGHPAISGGAGIGTPVSQAPEPQVASCGHSGRAKGLEVPPVPITPEPGKSRGWGGHRACLRVRQPELDSLARDFQVRSRGAGHLPCDR